MQLKSDFWREHFPTFGGENLPLILLNLPERKVRRELDHQNGLIFALLMVAIRSATGAWDSCNKIIKFHFMITCTMNLPNLIAYLFIDLLHTAQSWHRKEQ